MFSPSSGMSTPSKQQPTPQSYSPSKAAPTPSPIPPLSSTSLLKKHIAAGAVDPRQAAIEQAQAERSSLHTKNEQLWKLIERQKAGYNQLVEELERARKERDAYKAKLKAVATGSDLESNHLAPSPSKVAT
ncbi:hypothetical protein MIND_01223200 [Mycena indigotica]|uniref:Uncharacterized protein n=1 Tax=Mycena indigotica TaxID=2126181 RepID=A0A8H6S4C0_9AGAR|nr:uncharacterized protein MIND_01223200 [Mycena indigotica]KAF7291975.1 hypothetical protein MIND_01223200 [Mycena indigotica]